MPFFLRGRRPRSRPRLTRRQDQPPRDSLHVDWHCHSQWSDGRATVEELADQAALRGVTLGVSDHGLRDNRRLRTAEQLSAYLDHLGQYPVLQGLEISVGDLPSAAPAPPASGGGGQRSSSEDQSGGAARPPQSGLLDRFEYVIASLHVIDVPEGAVHATRYLNWRAGLYPFYRPTLARYDRRGYFDAWLRALAATAAQWPVTILGHFCLLPELAKADGTYVLRADPEPDREAADWLDATIELCCRHNIAIELNSKSRVPHAAFVARALELGARFSLGSDAHHRDRAGDLSYGRALVARLGIPADRVLGTSAVRPPRPWGALPGPAVRQYPGWPGAGPRGPTGAGRAGRGRLAEPRRQPVGAVG
jgi:histidinol phosphatase-like PHP family hydrolase